MPQLTHDLIARAVPPPPPGPDAPPLDEARLRAEMKVFLHSRAPGLGIWVFAYGALMWSHAECAPDIVVPARLPGFARHYAPRDRRDRGTPAGPGLTLGIEASPALACSGLLLHLPGPEVEARLWPVWKQEMEPGLYEPQWHTATLHAAREPGGAPVRALCFVTRRGGALDSGDLPVSAVADVLARASGSGGTAAAYLLDAAETLRQNGMRDALLESLEAEVAHRLTARAATPSTT